jgi:hypothetical protein
VRGFPTQADRYGFIEAANGIDDMGIKFDTFIFGVTQFPIRSKVGQVLLLERFFGFGGVCLNGETRMAGDETEHSDGDVLGFSGSEHFLNHTGVGGLPIRMQDAGVDTETDAIAMLLAEPGGVDSLVEVSGIQFVLRDCFGAIDTPGNDGLVIGFDGKQIADISAFGEQAKVRVGQVGEEIHEHRREVCNVVESERIKHFAHIEADFVQPVISEFCDLPEHCVVIDVDFYEGVIFAIDEREVAVCAAIRTAVGDGDEFVIRAAADMRAEVTVEIIDERGCPANHQGSLAFNDCLAGSSGVGEVSLMAYDFYLCGGKKLNDSPCLGVIGYFSPK